MKILFSIILILSEMVSNGQLINIINQQNKRRVVVPPSAQSFTLSAPARTSAGVYTTSGTLVRTLWSNVDFDAGTYTPKWDGTNDTLVDLAVDNYVIKVLTNNVQYEWQGVIGNSSDNMTGSTKHHAFLPVHGMAIVGSTIYAGTGYNEANPGTIKMNTSTTGQRTYILKSSNSSVDQGTLFVCADATNVYWGGRDDFSSTHNFVFGTKVSDDLETSFSSDTSYQMTFGRLYSSVIDHVANANGGVTGMAVQQSGNYLFVSHSALGEIHVLHKTTGALAQTVTSFTTPKAMCVDGSDNLWVISGTNTITKHTINSGTGAVSASVLSITGTTAPLAIAVSYDGATVVVADGGSSQQVKGYGNTTGSSSWTFGTAGGYVNAPTVANDKFYFSDATGSVINPFIAFESDGSFWVGDQGNYRVQHYNSSRTFINRIMYIPVSYSSYSDPNDPTRVFSGHLEFAIDYGQTLDNGANGSWTLVKNWRANITTDYYGGFNTFRSIATLSNGRTYGFLRNYTSGMDEAVELASTGIRYTGITFNYQYINIAKDGAFLSSPINAIGGTMAWSKRELTGFDGSNNPIWGSATTLASTTQTTNKDPILGSPYSTMPEITASNIVIGFNGGSPPSGGSSGYHLGGIAVGGSQWLWKTALSTHANYEGEFPPDGYYDIGNGATYSGNIAMVIDRNIFWGYNGEYWKASQTNKYNHFYDNGLFIGQFGTTGPEVANTEGPPEMAGNAFSPSTVKVGSDYYLYHNDESYHGGVHRWKISNLSSITEHTIPITTAFVRSDEHPVLPGVDLMAGLPFNDANLTNNTAGWTRNPTTNSGTWIVKTSFKTYDYIRKPTDVWIKYAQATGTYTVSRDLGSNSGLSAWTLSGKIHWDLSMPNTSDIGSFLEILDNAGKVLVRFYVDMDFGSNPVSRHVYANGTEIVTGNNFAFERVLAEFQNISISKVGASLEVTYANYTPVTVSIYDGTGTIGNPTTMRIYFTSVAGAYGKTVSIKDFRFSNAP